MASSLMIVWFTKSDFQIELLQRDEDGYFICWSYIYIGAFALL